MVDDESRYSMNSGIVSPDGITWSVDEFMAGRILINIVSDHHGHICTNPCHITDMKSMDLGNGCNRNQHSNSRSIS